MIILLSAERSNLDSEVNQHNTNSMRYSLARLGLYFESVNGVYKGVSEDSFMVFGIQSKPMFDRIVNLAALFNQESILVVDSDSSARLEYLESGESVNIGTFTQVDSVLGLDAYTVTDDGKMYAVK